MEDHPAPHARAGEPPCRAGAGDPQIPSRQQRTIKGSARLNDKTMNMKTRSFALGCAALCCALAVVLPVRTTAAAIDDQQFNELKDLVTKLGQKIDKQDQRIDQLEKTHAQDGQVHTQDQKTHEQDQQKIKELEQKLGETRRTVAEVQQKAAAAGPVEPLPRMPL